MLDFKSSCANIEFVRKVTHKYFIIGLKTKLSFDVFVKIKKIV